MRRHDECAHEATNDDGTRLSTYRTGGTDEMQHILAKLACQHASRPNRMT